MSYSLEFFSLVVVVVGKILRRYTLFENVLKLSKTANNETFAPNVALELEESQQHRKH